MKNKIKVFVVLAFMALVIGFNETSATTFGEKARLIAYGETDYVGGAALSAIVTEKNELYISGTLYSSAFNQTVTGEKLQLQSYTKIDTSGIDGNIIKVMLNGEINYEQGRLNWEPNIDYNIGTHYILTDKGNLYVTGAFYETSKNTTTNIDELIFEKITVPESVSMVYEMYPIPRAEKVIGFKKVNGVFSKGEAISDFSCATGSINHNLDNIAYLESETTTTNLKFLIVDSMCSAVSKTGKVYLFTPSYNENGWIGGTFNYPVVSEYCLNPVFEGRCGDQKYSPVFYDDGTDAYQHYKDFLASFSKNPVSELSLPNNLKAKKINRILTTHNTLSTIYVTDENDDIWLRGYSNEAMDGDMGNGMDMNLDFKKIPNSADTNVKMKAILDQGSFYNFPNVDSREDQTLSKTMTHNLLMLGEDNKIYLFSPRNYEMTSMYISDISIDPNATLKPNLFRGGITVDPTEIINFTNYSSNLILKDTNGDIIIGSGSLNNEISGKNTEWGDEKPTYKLKRNNVVTTEQCAISYNDISKSYAYVYGLTKEKLSEFLSSQEFSYDPCWGEQAIGSMLRNYNTNTLNFNFEQNITVSKIPGLEFLKDAKAFNINEQTGEILYIDKDGYAKTIYHNEKTIISDSVSGKHSVGPTYVNGHTKTSNPQETQTPINDWKVFNPTTPKLLDAKNIETTINPKTALLGPVITGNNDVLAIWQITTLDGSITKSGEFSLKNIQSFDLSSLNLAKGQYTFTYYRKSFDPELNKEIRSELDASIDFTIEEITSEAIIKLPSTGTKLPNTGNDLNVIYLMLSLSILSYGMYRRQIR